MSESFHYGIGRKVISRDSAEELGTVGNFLVDARRGQVTSIVVGHGRKARLVDWDQLAAFGPDAVMIRADDSLREPADDRERDGVDGKLDLIGKKALTESGCELGKVDDVNFDPETGALQTLRIGDREMPADALLGSGTYAAVLRLRQEEATNAPGH
jgi:sporulation protein YlmC with PRC-barrel domain